MQISINHCLPGSSALCISLEQGMVLMQGVQLAVLDLRSEVVAKVEKIHISPKEVDGGSYPRFDIQVQMPELDHPTFSDMMRSVSTRASWTVAQVHTAVLRVINELFARSEERIQAKAGLAEASAD